MNPRSTLVIALVICGLAQSTEIQNDETQFAEMESMTESVIDVEDNPLYLPAEAREINSGPLAHQSISRPLPMHPNPVHQMGAYHRPTYHHPATGYQHPQAETTQPQNSHVEPTAYQQPHKPVYQSSQLGVSVSSYQPQNVGGVGLLKHQKEPSLDKKIIPALKNVKPEYYPKESSYASIPAQPKEVNHSPRFVANPGRNQAIESISPMQLQQLTMQQQPQPYAVVQHPHGLHLPQYSGPAASPYMVMPFNHQEQLATEAVTVKYEETEHGFMDRMWGEVASVRDTISEGFFETLPSIFRDLWDAIVGAVSSTTARMLGSFEWTDVLQLIVKQLN